jgi:uncharacterized membrane protein YccC
MLVATGPCVFSFIMKTIRWFESAAIARAQDIEIPLSRYSRESPERDVDLAKTSSQQGSWPHETLGLGRKEPSCRTAVAATASVIMARLVQMPEAYWAAIATLVVMQSTLGATLTLSIGRIVATAVGASVGAVEANFFGANLAAFAVAILLTGLLSIAFRLEKTAYRYASITLAIIVLIPRSASPWTIALHRFIEVSVGIIVALAFVALWPELPPSVANEAEE